MPERPLRVGRVDFINTFPVRWALERQLEPTLAEDIAAVPTELNRMLHAGELDVANVSSVEYAAHAADYVLLPSLCIGSEGAVESVVLITDVPLPAVRTVAATAKSAASVALVRTLLPGVEILPEDAGADARLLIGDEALRSSLEDPTPHHDLGTLWHERTGLPMVFAVWAARRDTTTPESLNALDRALSACVADAAEHATQVARDAAEQHGFPAGFLARYFEKLRYRFGERERLALGSFFEAAAAAGAIEHAPPLAFAGVPSTSEAR